MTELFNRSLLENTTGSLIAHAGWDARLALSDNETLLMRESVAVLNKVVADGRRVYGVTQGFGPLVRFTASESLQDQGLGLISHLANGQGEPLSPEVTRYMLWLRLSGMRQGHSAVCPEFWQKMAHLWNLGFTPVVPSDGSLSASGDLIPLAHAAQAFAGRGEAWAKSGTEWVRLPAKQVFDALGEEPCVWNAREALAFVNGTSASLAVACFNHKAISLIARSLAAMSGRMAFLLGSNPEAYSVGISAVRGQNGQIKVARWIRMELDPNATQNPNRILQEAYSLRCAPQVIGAVVDQLEAQEAILVREAQGITDNPVIYEDDVLHGGNFHAAPVVLCSDQQALCLHQLAFLAERQLALWLDPVYNGAKPPMLTPNPGPNSGLAGVQLAASSFVSKIRQLSYPASLTALPTNLGNQDHVPMALNGANTVAKLIEYGWWVIGSLALAINQWTYLEKIEVEQGTLWSALQNAIASLDRDRPLSEDVRIAASLVKEFGERM
jgi:histidine ammonia-lyase